MTSVESIAAPAVAVRNAAGPVGLDAAFEARWTAWRARGVAHERAVRRRLLVVLPALTVGVAFVYLLLMW